MTTIPAVSLASFFDSSPEQQRCIASEVDSICKQIGFLVIEDHGVSWDVIDRAWNGCRAFFDLPTAEKLKVKSPDPGCPRGYFPLAAEALAKSLGAETPPDLKESFSVGPLRGPKSGITEADLEFHFGPNLWPGRPAELREALTAYFNELQALGSRILRLFAAALALPHDYFEQFHTHPMCAMRCLNYPAEDEQPLPGQLGAGAHADYGSITILKSDPLVSGLEVKLPTGEWSAAPLLDDAFIVNIGDMMARWTNDRWVSTLHRVANSGEEKRRQSIAFFHNANFDASINCIPTCAEGNEAKYQPVNAGEYLASRFRSALASN